MRHNPCCPLCFCLSHTCTTDCVLYTTTVVSLSAAPSFTTPQQRETRHSKNQSYKLSTSTTDITAIEYRHRRQQPLISEIHSCSRTEAIDRSTSRFCRVFLATRPCSQLPMWVVLGMRSRRPQPKHNPHNLSSIYRDMYGPCNNTVRNVATLLVSLISRNPGDR